MKNGPPPLAREYRYLAQAPELRYTPTPTVLRESADGKQEDKAALDDGVPTSTPPKEHSKSAPAVRGYAALFDSKSENLGWADFAFYEIIERGAFDGLDYAQVVALFNHDQNLPLARYGAGLSLGVDTRGLWYEFTLPDTTAGRDLHELLKAGIVSQSSFAFTVEDDGQEWDEHYSTDGKIVSTRTIKKISALYDVSLVTRPAYADTTVALRSLHAHRAEKGQQKLPFSGRALARALSAEVYALTGLPLPPAAP